MKQFTLHKTERIKKRKDIDALFKEGKSIAYYPLRAYYFIGLNSNNADIITNNNAPLKEHLQFGVAVSKKHFKKAVDRNRIKRLIREAYRLQKMQLQNALLKQQHLKVFFIYTGKEMPNFELMKQKVAAILAVLEKQVNNL